MSDAKQKILIIDDHSLFADGLALILKTLGDGIEVSVANNAGQVLRENESLLSYDLVLIDLHMPAMDGFSFLSAVRAQKLPLRVGVISGTESKADIERSIALGACGFIPKDTSSTQMHWAVKRLMEGFQYLPKHWEGKIDWRSCHRPKAEDDNITKRQQQVLELIRDGLQNKQIATVLGISLSAVKGHVENIFRVLHVNNRTSCAEAARKQGLI